MRIATWLGGRKAGPTVARSAIAASVIRGARHSYRAAFGASSEAGTSSSADVRFAPQFRPFEFHHLMLQRGHSCEYAGGSRLATAFSNKADGGTHTGGCRGETGGRICALHLIVS